MIPKQSLLSDLGQRTLTDMTLLPSVEPIMTSGIGSSDRGNAGREIKPKKKTMTSLYLRFFETALDGKNRMCKLCKKSYSITTATGNLGRHLNNRHPGYDRVAEAASESQQAVVVRNKKHQATARAQAQAKPAIDLDHVNWLLVRWLISSSLPPSALDDDMLINTCKFLNSSVKLWPADRVQAITLEVFRSMKEEVMASLQHISYRVSITLDFWTSYEQLLYMSVRCHWIDENWVLHKVLIDVCRIPYPCAGSEILQVLTNVLLAFNIDSKILACTHSNSQQAIHACCQLKQELDSRKIPFCYIPCAARTLKMIVEDGLSNIKPILSKIREFVLELNSSLEMMEDFKQWTTLYQEGSWKVPFDNSPNWNTDYAMLDLAKKAHNSMDSTMKKLEENLGPRDRLLKATEQSVISTLHSYLEPFYKTTTNLCTCKVPTVGLVLFFMDHAFELINVCHESCRHEWLKNIASDMSKRAHNFAAQAYNIFTFTAAILDPRIKRELLPESLNSDKNLEEARSHFVRDYSSSHFPAMANGYSSQDTSEETSAFSFAEEIVRKRRRMSLTAAADELSQYLSEPPAPMSTDVLEWWRGHSPRYPRLSLMARDFLAIQGTSVDPAELFTSKGDSIHKQKYCLPLSSTQAVMCINSWMESGYRFKFQSTVIDFERLVESSTQSVDTTNDF